MIPFYRWILASPHEDKKLLEKAVIAAGRETDSPIGGFIIVRASWMTDGERLGTEKVRTGTETPGKRGSASNNEKPAIGYSISRQDVGGWIFDEVVEKREEKWVGKYVSLTH